MITRLFSAFDPKGGSIFLELNWVILLFPILSFQSTYFSKWCGSASLYSFSQIRLVKLFLPYLSKNNNNKCVILFMSFYFLTIVKINYTGLLPYVFSCTVHPAFVILLVLPAWFGIILINFNLRFIDILAHTVPVNTPIYLVNILILIETIRLLMRPVALIVRLCVNIIAGHILITLLSYGGVYVLLGQIGLLLFELVVCIIQAYVLSVLLRLYISELD